MVNKKSFGVLLAGTIVSALAAYIRLNARTIAWTPGTYWSGQVEATPSYAKQLAIADVSNLVLAFGLIITVAGIVTYLFKENK